MSNPKISICVPTHNIPEKDEFLARLVDSLVKQTYTNWELVVTEEGKMAENTNAAIKKTTGEIIKILYMDDYLYSEDALQHIADSFTGGWLASGCVHDDGTIYGPHNAEWSLDVFKGVNTIGSPSVLAFVNDEPLLFDERMSWTLDIDLYRRLYQRYGKPTIIDSLDVAIGIGPHQMTNKLSEEDKGAEHTLFMQKQISEDML